MLLPGDLLEGEFLLRVGADVFKNVLDALIGDVLLLPILRRVWNEVFQTHQKGENGEHRRDDLTAVAPGALDVHAHDA